MTVSNTWDIPGAEDLPIHGNTHTPDAGSPRAVAIVVHGWTGNKDRNINPAIAAFLADEANIIAHRVTLSHAGVARDGDDITQPDEFARDSNAFCVTDVRCVVDAIDGGVIPGKGLAMILIGHSRGGATIYRCAAHAENDPWRIKPAALISLSATATLTRLTDDIKRQLHEKGYVERECARGPGGMVRMGRSWYEHHLDHPDHDYFAEAVAGVRCPVLIAHGAEDTSVEPRHADGIAAMFKERNPEIRPRVVKIPGADHNYNVLGYRPNVETMNNPAVRRLYGAISAFLDEAL